MGRETDSAGDAAPDARPGLDHPLTGSHRNQARALLDSRLGGYRIVVRSDSHARVEALVAAGVGCAIVPGVGIDDAGSVSVIELADPLAPLGLGLFWRTGVTPAPCAQQFRGIIERRVGRELSS